VAADPVDILGGKSVYCINRGQQAEALRLANEDSESGPRIQGALTALEESLTRNERAALAFLIIERLRDADAA
jgi:hypothetical protein